MTSTRRSEAACETAQKFADARQPSWPAPLTLIVRLDSERQKLFSATQLAACGPSARQRL